MKILEAEETEQLVPIPAGPVSKFYVALCQLHRGQSLLIEKSEWNHRYPPFYMATNLEKRHSYVQYERLKVAEGWIMKRVK